MLAYADDIVVVTDSLPNMNDVLREINLELNEIGLTINEKKSNIILRDPVQCHAPLKANVQLNGQRTTV